MTHFGIICPAPAGHLNPMTSLGYELKGRGHCVTLFGVLDVKSKAEATGLCFSPIGKSEYPIGEVSRSVKRLGELSGLAASQYTFIQLKQQADVTLRDTPQAIRGVGVEALLVDQLSPEGGTIAEFLEIPFVTVSSSLIMNQEESIPPFFTPWAFDPSWWAILRNQLVYGLYNYLEKPLWDLIAVYRQQWNLPHYSHSRDSYSQLAQLSQQPAELEFPRQTLSQCFHFTGPFSNPASREPANFPLTRLTGQPLIYASLGTVQNRLLWIFHDIAQACAEIDIQLVISLGGSTEPEALPEMPGNPLVVEYAPQLALLQKATLTITHAGMNTVLESLSNGVPIVAIPITNDQPGVAARIAWTGTGEVVPLDRVSVPKLRAAIKRVLSDDSYRRNATRLKGVIGRAGGVSRAADIVVQAIYTGKPVLR